MNDQEFEYLKRKMLILAGIDLDSYKIQQVRRRLDGFVASQPEAPVAYCDRLARDRDAVRELRQFLTINVSEFFRDKEQFQTLRTSVLPALLTKSPSLKVWSAGCSHGEEPYSLAILLKELKPDRAHRILATDVNEKVLAMARQGGPYEANQIKNVDRVALLKYFVKAGDAYQVAPQIKGMVRFEQHNMLGDPPDAGFDLIVCRNVVIYFTDEAKNRLVKGFWRALKEDGVLFLGACEQLAPIAGTDFMRLAPSIHRKRARSNALAGG